MHSSAPSASRTEYRHVEKIARPEPSLALDETVLKWYDIAPDEAPVPLAVRALARRSLRDASRTGVLGALGRTRLRDPPPLRRELLLPPRLHVAQRERALGDGVGEGRRRATSSSEPWPLEGTHRPTFCVWELGAVCHEREAWTRYLLSPRDERARRRLPPRQLLADSSDGSSSRRNRAVPRPGRARRARGTGRRTCASRSQWTEHAQFMNGLVDDGLILLGRPGRGGREAFHVVHAPSEEAVCARASRRTRGRGTGC